MTDLRLNPDVAARLATDPELWRDFNDICNTGGRLAGTESEKKAMAVNSDRNEPTIRPCTPKCAPEDTALLVPLIGPAPG